MMNLSTLARPYAAALFEGAKTQSERSAWLQVLEVLAVVANDVKIRQLALNPKISSALLESILQDIVATVVPDFATQLGIKFKNFIQLIVENKRLNIFPSMLTIYQKLLEKSQNKMNVSVSSAFELSEKQLEQLRQALSKRFNSAVSIEFSVDKNLIGGAVIRTDDFVIDGSIKDKLNRLYHSLQD